MHNLVVCCDGTWNTPDRADGGIPCPTNVVRFSNALAGTDAAGTPQLTYYHPGVGTEGGLVARITGGGLGAGLDRNIMSAMRWLAVHYRPGDRIHLVGFSRGAYTVRSLGGVLGRCGLLDLSADDLTEREKWAQVAAVFACYRAKKDARSVRGARFFNAASAAEAPGRTPVHFMGVWDTVGALGIPDDLFLLKLLAHPRSHAFHDTDLGPHVINARHAVAIDEMRRSFAPTLWTNVAGRPTVKQTWFPGAHSDVGGGYVQTGLSDAALAWMITEAEQLGLAFRPEMLSQLRPDPLDVLHNSVTGLFLALRTNPRCVPCLVPASVDEGIVHPSAIVRRDSPPISQSPYGETWFVPDHAVATCQVYASQTWNRTGFYLTPDREYLLEADGEWLDGDVKSGPEGTDGSGFHITSLFELAGSALGEAEDLYRRATGDRSADFWWTRREEKYPWFSLVGVIANATGADPDGNILPHQTFLVGRRARIRPAAAGYLYAFANDAWQAYGNNRGSVTLRLSVA